MANSRRAFSPAEHVALTTQVEGRCPECGAAIFYKKRGKSYKDYDLAHIYPLNPTEAEIEELAGVERLSDDPNHTDNIIPLCLRCHGRFDKPRTAEEYQVLLAKKRQALRRIEQQELQAAYHIEDQIREVIEQLHQHEVATDTAELAYDPKRLTDKFDVTMSTPTRQKIRHAVADFFPVVRASFLALERESPAASQLIHAQVRAFYLKQRALGLAQPEVFANIVAWLSQRAQPPSIEAIEIVTSYFVQNCEVFE